MWYVESQKMRHVVSRETANEARGRERDNECMEKINRPTSTE
jgi:hypothetical protein